MSKYQLTPIEAVYSMLRAMDRRPTPEQAAQIRRIRAALDPLQQQIDAERNYHQRGGNTDEEAEATDTREPNHVHSAD